MTTEFITENDTQGPASAGPQNKGMTTCRILSLPTNTSLTVRFSESSTTQLPTILKLGQLGQFVGWHKKYIIGDKHNFAAPEDFFLHLIALSQKMPFMIMLVVM